MAILFLPVTKDEPYYQFKTDLEDNTYYFEFRYNSRSLKWTMAILDDELNYIKSGIPIFTGLDLLSKYNDENLPAGTLLVVNYANSVTDPDRDTFSIDTKLIYWESE